MEIEFAPNQLERYRTRRILEGLAIGIFALAPFGFFSVFTDGGRNLVLIQCLIGLTTIIVCLYRYYALDQRITVTLEPETLRISRLSRRGGSVESYPLHTLYNSKFTSRGEFNVLSMSFIEQPGLLLLAPGNADNGDLKIVAELLSERPYCAPPKYGLPWVSLSIVLLCCIVFLLADVQDPIHGLDRMMSFGAWSAERLAVGEWYRFISYAFLHASWAHLAINCTSLFMLGAALEFYLGRLQILLVFLAGAVLASIPVFWTSFIFAVGASGGLFALLGGYLMLKLLSPADFVDRYPYISAPLIMIFVVVDLIVCLFVDGVAIYVHTAGWLVGAALIYARSLKPRLLDSAMTIVILIALLSRPFAGGWNDTKALQLAEGWLASDEPVRRLVAPGYIALNPVSRPEQLTAALRHVTDTFDATIFESRDDISDQETDKANTYTTLLFRLDRLEEAIALGNTLLNRVDKFEREHASQIVRFQLARNARFGIPDAAAFERSYVDALCTARDEVFFYRQPSDAPRESAQCDSPLRVIGRFEGAGKTLHHLQLDPRILALPGPADSKARD